MCGVWERREEPHGETRCVAMDAGARCELAPRFTRVHTASSQPVEWQAPLRPPPRRRRHCQLCIWLGPSLELFVHTRWERTDNCVVAALVQERRGLRRHAGAIQRRCRRRRRAHYTAGVTTAPSHPSHPVHRRPTCRSGCSARCSARRVNRALRIRSSAGADPYCVNRSTA